MTVSMQLERYIVNNIVFEVNEAFDMKQAKEINIKPAFQRAIAKLSEDTALVKLSIIVNNTEKLLPFGMNVTVSGIFRLEGWNTDPYKRKAIEENTVNILFPFLRGLVNNITANAGLPPYILPIMNIAEMFKQAAMQQPDYSRLS